MQQCDVEIGKREAIARLIQQAVDAERAACADIAGNEVSFGGKNGWTEYQRAAHNIEVMIIARANTR